jgi:hypothetical protein
MFVSAQKPQPRTQFCQLLPTTYPDENGNFEKNEMAKGIGAASDTTPTTAPGYVWSCSFQRNSLNLEPNFCKLLTTTKMGI